ncbi:MAG: PDZ domain-containing protein [Deltaproteobacteria bacterium]|jgi:membrane-associated protease RseP (regulator of RpoE activity)|nr:PDZ domain-containing protein [Deltaproteobacteria bacterium]
MRSTAAISLAAGLLFSSAGCSTHPAVTPDRELSDAALHEEFAEASVRLYVQRQARLLAVNYAIRTAGADLCGDAVGPILGIAAWRSNPLFGRAFFEALERSYGVWAGSIAVVVQPGSPADRAGIRVGDQILHVAGAAVHSDVDVFDRAAAFETGAIPIGLLRGEREIRVAVDPLRACRPEAFLEIGDLMLTDRARGDHFYVTSCFIRFAKTDDDLALVVAHELAHRISGMRVIPGPQVEVRADRLGLYLAARAGYDISIAPAFWDRVAVEQPWSLSDDVEHYGWTRVPPHGYMPSRAAAIRKIVAEIQRKIENGKPLQPGKI